MLDTTRRKLFKACVAAAASPLAFLSPASSAAASSVPAVNCVSRRPQWGQGVEGQRTADLGNGTFLNPIIAGDRPDPSILKDGND
jgi:xylan 1,4-beta-xylosidase